MMKFNERYQSENFLDFLTEFLPEDFVEKEEDVLINKDRYKEITEAKVLGFCESLDLHVLEMDHSRENDPRIAIATDAFKILADHWIHKALVIFKNKESENYRFSYLTISLDLNEKNKAVKRYSNARRLSFYLGAHAKTRTPEQQLIKRGRVKDIEDLLSRFSVEVVNKQFYLEVAKYFDELVLSDKQNLILPSTSIENVNIRKSFAVRLIGRLMFCWFLKQKKSDAGQLIPDELLSSSIVTEHYYHNVLEPLFFGVLNTSVESRGIRNDLFDKVPYLNGGLFNPQTEDFYDLDKSTYTSKYINTLKISDGWFKGFFELLETYNFTIDENTVFDQELSVDPEMLGRIFENLLAEINPETGSSERKRTGSFYTPRQIVEYMVDQSLIEYFKTKTNIDAKKIAALLSYDLSDDSENPLEEGEKQEIVSAVESLKILDPACGSGAFPIGALQKIVYVLQTVDPGCKMWLDLKLKGIPELYKQKIINEVKSNPFDYTRKLDVIKNSIFGVDIQPIAVDVSRLRCFLTLVVESEINDARPNRGIEPLPNLDFKFVCANTLVPAPEQHVTNDNALFADDFQDKLALAVDRYFSLTGENKRIANNEIHNLIAGKIDEKYRHISGLVSYFGDKKIESVLAQTNKKQIEQHSRILALWSSYKNIFENRSVGFFDSKYFFPSVKTGFDVVIANPPYIDSETMVKTGQAVLREELQRTYKWTKGNWDIYIAFFELGFRELSKQGSLTFITPDKWISKSFGNEFRKETMANIYLILKAGRKVFENAKVDSIISFFSQNVSSTLKIVDYQNNNFVLKREVDKSTIPSPYAFDHLFSSSLGLLSRIDSFDQKISDYCTCENACATSDAYKLKPYIRDLGESEVDFNKYLLIINTGTIGRFYSKWGKKMMVYLGDRYFFPVIEKEEFIRTFKNSYGVKSIKPKIILKGINLLDAYLDYQGTTIPGKTTLIIADNDTEKLKFILAIVTSQLALFYFKEKYPSSSYNQGISFTKDMINNFPVPAIKEADKNNLINYVNEIIFIAASSDYFVNIEKQAMVKGIESNINHLVNRLYGLDTEEESFVKDSIEG